MIEMNQLLTRKQRFVLRQLTKSINQLAVFMSAQGISSHDVNAFFMETVFQASSSSKPYRKKRLSHQFSSQTESQTNSETSDRLSGNIEIALEKAITSQLEAGQTLERILLAYAERCCVEEEKLRNYLVEEEDGVGRSGEFKGWGDFERVRERIHLKKYVSRIDLSNQSPIRHSLINPNPSPSLTSIHSLQSHYQPITPRRKRVLIDETQNQLDYMHSFQRSLAESIRKTKLLRGMLEKQLSFERSSLSFNDNDDYEEEGRQEEEEIY